MAAGGRVLGEAWIVISPDTEGFLTDLTAKVKAAVTGVPQQNVKVGADTTPVTAAMTRVRSELAAVTAKVANIKFGADDTALAAAVTKMLNRVALLDKQMRAMELAADPAKMDAAIAKQNVKLAGLAKQLRSLEMGADTSKIDTQMAKEVAATAGLQQKLSSMQLTLNDAEAVYELKHLENQAEQIRQALDKIPGDVEDTLLNRKLDVILARIGVLKSDARKIELRGDVTRLFATLTGTEDRLMRLRAEAAGIRLMNAAQIAAVQAEIAATTSEVGVLRAEADRVRLGGLTMAEITSLAAGIAGLNDDVAKLNTSLAGTAIGPPGRALGELRIQAEKLDAELAGLHAELTDTAAVAKLAAMQVQSEKLKATLADLSVGGDPMRMAAAARDVASLAAGLERLTISTDATTSAWQKLQKWAFSGGGGLWGLGGTIGGIKLWHVALDGVIEAVIAVTGAVIAAASGVAALAETGKDVVTRLNAVRTVNAALGTEIPPLTGKFDGLVKAMAPRGIEIFGGALQAVNSQSGNLRKVIEPVVDLFDKWVAEIDIWLGRQQTFAGAIAHGTGYLAQFGQIIGNVTEAIHNLLSKDPGIAHYLMEILVALTGLLDAFTKLPKPLVELTIGLHGVYVWAAVLGGAFTKMLSPLVSLAGWVTKVGGGFRDMAGAMAAAKTEEAAAAMVTAGTAAEGEAASVGRLGAAFATARGAVAGFAAGLGALAAAAAVAVIIAGVIYEMRQAGAAARGFVGDMNDALNQMKASDAIPAIEADIGQLNDKIRTAFGPQNIAAITSTFGGSSIVSMGRFKSNLVAMGDAAVGFKDVMTGVFTQDGSKILGGFSALVSSFHAKHDAAMHQAGEEVKAYNDELTHLKATQGDYFLTLGNLIKQHYSVAASFALMDLAGVKASDTYEVMRQKVKNLIDGYKSVTGTGGALEASVNAVTFAALQQQEKVGQLNQGWDTFMKTLSGGESGFNAFATQTEGLYQTLTTSGLKLTDSSGKVGMSLKLAADAAQGGKVSMTGINSASLMARDTFLKTADAANTQMDNLSLLANAAGKGQQGVNMLNQANKDMVASMLPAAKGSQAMTDILYGLAQRGGYQGADSFKALSEWVGKTRDPMKNLDGITTTLTTDAADLTNDVKNLSIALGTTLNAAMAQAVITANGGQKIFTDFASAVLKTGLNSKSTHDTAQQLAQSLLNLTGNARDAHNQFLTFAQEALHLTRDQAENLWKSVAGKLTPALNDAAGWARKGKDDFEKFAGEGGKGGLGLTAKQADNLWKKLSKDGLGGVLADLATSKAPNARAEFEKLAGDKTHGLGLTRDQADKLWSKLHGDLGKELAALSGAQGSVPQSKKAFEEWAGAGGKSGLSLTTKQADALFTMLGGTGKGGLKQAIDNLPTHKTVTITADTSGIDKALNQVQQRLGTDIGGGTLGPAGRGAIGKQAGGLITQGSGPTADDVHLMASRGEFVMRAAAVAHYGTGVMHALNAGALHPGLLGAVAGHRAAGGPVGMQSGGPVGMQSGGAVGGGGGSLSLMGSVAQLTGQLSTLFTQKIPGWLGSFATTGSTTFTKTAGSLQVNFTSKLQDLFTKTLPGYWDTHVAADGKTAWTDAATAQQAQFATPTSALFTKTIPGYWDTHVTGDGKTAFTSSATNMQTIFAAPMSTLFTKSIPGWLTGFTSGAKTAFQVSQGNFSSLMSKPIGKSIASWSGDIASAFKSGWNSVASLFNNNVINWINNNILSHLPGKLSIAHIPTFAAGGMVRMGSGPTADDVHALLSRGELVVPTHLVNAGAVDHLRGKLPGFAAGGVAGYQGGGLALKSPNAGTPYVNPVGRGAVGSRIDMGVDYTGVFDLYALGAGTIRNLYSGWPGGHFISLQLDEGAYKNALWFYAENIAPAVTVGQHVKAGQKIGHAPGGYPWTELGWAANATGTTMAAASGQAKRGQAAGDAGRYSTAWGIAANNLIVSLGGPSGIVSPGGISGGGPNALSRVAGLFASIWQSVEGLLDSAGTGLSSLVSPLGKYVPGGAKALLGLANKGAQAIFNAVWDSSVRPLLGKLPMGSMPGAFVGSMADKLKGGIAGFFGAKDAQAQSQAQSVSGGLGPTSADAAAAQAYARSRMGAFGWTAPNEWPALQALWTGESNWSRLARNPGSGAYGIPQALPASKMGPAANPPTSSAGAQIDWGMNYIKSNPGYGDPATAYAKWLSRSPHWYDKGGVLPPGMSLVMNGTGRDETVIPAPPHEVASFAAGGPVTTQAGLRFWLGAAQYGEEIKYAGLRYAFEHGPRGYLNKTTVSELGVLAKRQAAEVAAYKALAGSGLTASHLKHLGSMAREAASTAADKMLNRMPGGHPGFASDLRKYLAQISALAAKPVPAGPPAAVKSAEQMRFWLGAAQYGELLKYRGLEASFLHGPRKYLTKGVQEQLYALALQQKAEELAYAHLAGPGLTPANLAKLGSAARAEAAAARHREFSAMPGGHPLWAKDLEKYLGQLSALSGQRFINPAWVPTGLGASYSTHPGVLRFARGGQVFDQGGVLAPGWNTMFNGTGAEERLVPAGHAGEIHVHVHNSGVIGSQAEVETWLVRSMNYLARTGKLAQAVRTAG